MTSYRKKYGLTSDLSNSPPPQKRVESIKCLRYDDVFWFVKILSFPCLHTYLVLIIYMISWYVGINIESVIQRAIVLA